MGNLGQVSEAASKVVSVGLSSALTKKNGVLVRKGLVMDSECRIESNKRQSEESVNKALAYKNMNIVVATAILIE